MLVSTSGGFWPILLDDTKRHDRDILCIWPFCTILELVIGCLFEVILLVDGIQYRVPTALVIIVIEPKIRVKRPSRVNSSTKSTVYMLSIGIFEVNLLIPYKSLSYATWLACSLRRFQRCGTVD